MRTRTKECFKCNKKKEVLYRCRYDEFKDWVFLCGTCLTIIKSQHDNTYQYGGTWKSKKKGFPNVSRITLLYLLSVPVLQIY